MARPVASDVESDAVAGPPGLPLGHRVKLPGRGTTFVREVEGPTGAPTVLLLHGWCASAGLNWFQAFEPLSRHFRVIAPDHRGHGRGIRSRKHFKLADCADDMDVLCNELETGPVIAVGYSLGGPVAQLMWHRHPRHVSGMVLAATTTNVVPRLHEKLGFMMMMAAATSGSRAGGMVTHLPTRWARSLRPVSTDGHRPNTMQRWAGAEMRRHNWRMLFEAGRSISRYDGAGWIGDVDVPTTVLITARDRAIPPEAQRAMAEAIPGAATHEIDDGHLACSSAGFGDHVTTACLSVHRRVD